jgi:hypothetical protein
LSLASRTIKNIISMFGFLIIEMERNKRERYLVAPKLFYIYGPSNSETSLERVQRRHMYTKETNA